MSSNVLATGMSRTLAESLKETMKLLREWNASGEESLRVLRMYWTAEVLSAYSGNQCRAARRLGIHRNTIGRQIEELDLAAFLGGLVENHTPQMELFRTSVRKGPRRAGLAQDVFVLRRVPQGNSKAFRGLMHRAAAGSD